MIEGLGSVVFAYYVRKKKRRRSINLEGENYREVGKWKMENGEWKMSEDAVAGKRKCRESMFREVGACSSTDRRTACFPGKSNWPKQVVRACKYENV